MTFTFADPTEWWLEISPGSWTEAWQSSQRHSTVGSCWSAHLNRLCLNAVLPWLRTEYTSDIAVWPGSMQLPAIWEVVNGVALTVDTARLVLIPMETVDDAELEVPQEWVDIPSWAADYYLAVQIQPDRESSSPWMRVWGYTTHRDLKTRGRYDPDDRTYCLDGPALTNDMTTLWTTMQVWAAQQTRTAIAPLPELTPGHAATLLQRLGDGAIAFPRLAVPFALWGALLERDEWRQRLYHQRIQQGDEGGVGVVALRRWLQGQVAAGWQSLEALSGPRAGALAASFRSGVEINSAHTTQIKPIELDLQSGRQEVMLLLALNAEADEKIKITVQLHPPLEQPYVPANLNLSLLSETGEILQTVQSGEQDDYIQLRQFRCSSDTRFSVQIVLNECVVTEAFGV
jgi:Protein of unknown function (DUF1822)